MTTPLATLRLLQVTDSSFPVGGFAYSHGLEWLSKQRPLGEAELNAVLDAYARQVCIGQWLPAALASHRAGSDSARRRVDLALDASILAEVERNAGRAMGERLLVGAREAFGSALMGLATMLASIRAGQTPGQYAVAFGLLAGETGASPAETVAALGFAMVNSIAQAAVRLGLVGQAAAGRLVARASESVATAVPTLLEQSPRRLFGAFTPELDVAGILHPTLPFRMFAS